MKDRVFYTIVAIVSLVGVISTGVLVKYTIDLSKNLSITAYISNED